MSDIGAEQNHLWPTISYSAPAPPPFSGRATVVLARTSEPPCFSVIAMPEIADALLGGGDEARVVVRGRHQRLPLGRQLGLGAQRGHDREGHRDRAGEAGLGLHRGHVQRGARGVRVGLAARPRQRVQLVLDPHLSSAGARRGGTRPRRCGARSGRRCAAPACSRWPGGPIPAAARRRRSAPARRRARSPSRRPRARVASTSGRLLEKTSRPSSGGTWLKTSWVCHGAVLSPVACETVAMAGSVADGRVAAPARRRPEYARVDAGAGGHERVARGAAAAWRSRPRRSGAGAGAARCRSAEPSPPSEHPTAGASPSSPPATRSPNRRSGRRRPNGSGSEAARPRRRPRCSRRTATAVAAGLFGAGTKKAPSLVLYCRQRSSLDAAARSRRRARRRSPGRRTPATSPSRCSSTAIKGFAQQLRPRRSSTRRTGTLRTDRERHRLRRELRARRQ